MPPCVFLLAGEEGGREGYARHSLLLLVVLGKPAGSPVGKHRFCAVVVPTGVLVLFVFAATAACSSSPPAAAAAAAATAVNTASSSSSSSSSAFALALGRRK